MEQPTKQAPYASVNPVTGMLVQAFDAATEDEVSAALAVGDAAFSTWQGVDPQDRAGAAERVAQLFATRAEELALIAVEEMGKPMNEAVEEVEFCRDIFRYYAANGPDLIRDQPIETYCDDRAVVQKRPIGLLLGLMPWNFPYYQVARFAAPNLVLGNTMLVKHAESVPRCAEAIQQLFEQACVPTGVYQNLFATFDQVETIIADPRLRGVSLTGSERAGAAVAAVAGKHVKKCVLELGGSDPYIVLDCDDVDDAATLAWETRLYNTGQACNSNKRIIVMDDIYDRFVAKLVELADDLRPGDPKDLANGTYPPLSSHGAVARIKAIVDDAVARGARLLAGGVAGDGPGSYYSPGVLIDVTDEMRAYHEELFGPVAVVYKVASEEEAAQLANDTVYGLGGAVFSSDPERAARLAERLEVGMANVNIPAGEGAAIPFGGTKGSGFGRELGSLGMDEFANKRVYYVRVDS